MNDNIGISQGIRGTIVFFLIRRDFTSFVVCTFMKSSFARISFTLAVNVASSCLMLNSSGLGRVVYEGYLSCICTPCTEFCHNFLSFPNQLLLGWYGLVYAMAGIAEAGRDREGTKQTAKLIIGGSESEIQGFSSNSVKIRDMMRYSCSICMSPFSCPVYSHLPQVSFCSFCIGGRTSVWWAVLGVDWLTGGGAEGNNWEKAHKSNNDDPK